MPRTPKEQIESNLTALQGYIRNCKFEKTANAYAYTLCGLRRDLERKDIDTYKYHQYKDRAESMLKENRCKCIKAFN